MKKIVIGLIVLIAVVVCASGYLIYYYAPQGLFPTPGIRKLDNRGGEFSVYQSGNFVQSFSNLDDAVDFAKGFTLACVIRKGNERWVWDNYPQFSVYDSGAEYIFGTFNEALEYVQGKENAKIVNRANKAVIWGKDDRLPREHIIGGVPLVAQNPELPRGCEVTSLAMLLNYYGLGVSKTELAERVKKDETPFSQDKDGNITFGNPMNGFVGDMYDMSNPGLGVYHEPLFELLKEYIGTDALDISGTRFSDIYYFISKNKPVLVITTSVFKTVANDKFVIWNTAEGEIPVTNYEHAVVVKGYDSEYIYFNNPLDASGMQQAPIKEFVAAWEQMGMQAITYFE